MTSSTNTTWRFDGRQTFVRVPVGFWAIWDKFLEGSKLLCMLERRLTAVCRYRGKNSCAFIKGKKKRKPYIIFCKLKTKRPFVFFTISSKIESESLEQSCLHNSPLNYWKAKKKELILVNLSPVLLTLCPIFAWSSLM